MKIAITGTMGSGKSQVLHYLKNQGYHVSDADAIVDHLYAHDPILIQQLVELFSPAILSDGQVDKAKLKGLYFESEVLMGQANALVHQQVYAYLKELVINREELIFIEVPLLFETNKQKAFDEVWFIDTSETLRIQRLIENRAMTLQEIKQREKFHMKPLLKRFMSDVIIDNDQSLDKLYNQIDQHLERITHDFKQD